MTAIPFCGQAYSDKTLNANAQEAINLYPMITIDAASSDKKVAYSLPKKIIMYPTPGYKWQKYLAFGAIRGFYVINNILYIVAGTNLIVCSPIGGNTNLNEAIFTTVGTLNTAIGPVSIECNTVQLAISDGQFGYTYILSSGVFAVITGGSWPASGGVTNFTFIDGYVLGSINNSSTVIQSDVLDATTFGAQSFDTITSFPDNINAIFSDELQLYIFGPKICEVQSDAGSIPYAFQKVPNVLIQAGCVSWATIKKVANTFFFLASDIAGKAYVAALSSYDTKVISTPPINEQIQRYTKVSDAYSWVYREGDNHFYMITFPSAGVTWGYDIKTDLWHKRSINGGADLPTACILWQGMQVVGDAQGSLYIMSQDYTTYGVYNTHTGEVTDYPLDRIRTTAHVNAEGKTMFISELWVDMQVGSGFVTDTDLGTQPKTYPDKPTIVQQAQGFSSGLTTVIITINPSVAGNLIAIFIGSSLFPSSTITGITDNLGQVYKPVPGAFSNDTLGDNGDIWYFPDTQAGVTTITATFAVAPNAANAVAMEISGLKISGVVDVVSVLNNGLNQSSILTSAPLTTREKNDFILVGTNAQGDNNLSVAAPYRLDNSGFVGTYVPNDVVFNQSAVFTNSFSLANGGVASTVAFLAQPPITPLATLAVSKDFGRTWITVGTRSLGARGKTQQRVVWRNLGRYRQNCTFRLTISDPVQVFILGAKAQIKVGAK